ncbi:Heparosan-N-sulfate-glucuronate 5-epimerase [Aphelenchoides besseyi]|nr:Heparosan-N-sulfate-glucuronate 5-epimerase [Aphelenchoides besseyi]KAI6218266.1 Heparosan-N-sulfate-glucuronate 5-epimerase [Aphelenchoides besseyi]
MANLSTLAGGSLALSCASICKLPSTRLPVVLIRNSHAHVFRKRPGQLIVNRMKDVGHFYLIGIGLIPMSIVMIVSHIVYGPNCELKDYPTDGTIPHYWQFERTPLKQWWAKYFGPSDIQRHECNLAYHERMMVINRWRRFEDRVRHLQGERWDYKGWYYQPVSASWVDYARHQSLRYRDQYEAHGHYLVGSHADVCSGVFTAKPINCTIDERRNVRCWRDQRDVYLPFSFVRKQLSYDVDGRVVGENTSRLHFDYRTPGIKSKKPQIQSYNSFGSFANFGTFFVERRTKVGCVSGIHQLPMSVQWNVVPYLYPIQIGQFGLQHYSQMLNETAEKIVLASDDRIISNDKGPLPSVQSNMLHVDDNNAVTRIRLTSDVNLSILIFEWIPQTTSTSFSIVVFDQFANQNITLTYSFSEDNRCVWQEGIKKEFVYSLGLFTGPSAFQRVLRDFKIDVFKALLIDNDYVQNKEQYQAMELVFHGSMILKFPLKQQTHAHKEQFLISADWFVKSQNENGGWSVPVVRKWSEKVQLKAGWISAMAQGHAISVLVRAFNITNDRRYLDASMKALRPFETESIDGGVRTHLFGYAWYEEYPTSPSSLVLNGFMYSLIGLYDLSQVHFKDSEKAKHLFDTGIESLKVLLPLYDTGSGSIYDLKHVTMKSPPNLARGDYHDTHIYLLRLFHVITGHKMFKDFSDRWFAYTIGQRAKHN